MVWGVGGLHAFSDSMEMQPLCHGPERTHAAWKATDTRKNLGPSLSGLWCRDQIPKTFWDGPKVVWD
jgi:hypothetical protein